jgi:hypothetical protein
MAAPDAEPGEHASEPVHRSGQFPVSHHGAVVGADQGRVLAALMQDRQ